jgi:fructoselysine and glucoselysine-specific PTS system IID component
MTNSNANKVTKSDLKKMFWRSCSMDFSWNFERQCSMGYAFAMAPIIRKLYPEKEARAASLKRHLEFFNITSQVGTLPLGISAAMEEENVNTKNFDTASINSVKTALMGPLSAIGDSVFWGTLRLLATGIGTSLALQGQILGPILFLLVFNIPAFIVRYWLAGAGYNAGTGFLKRLEKAGTLGDLTYGAAILGLVVIGAMTATMVGVHTPLTIGQGDGAYPLQTMFDSFMTALLPLCAFGIIYKLLGKKVNSLAIVIGIFVVAILTALFGILG